MNNQKRKCPWFWKRKISCPECGFIYDEYHKEIHAKDFVDCPRCNVRLSNEEFWDENHFKMDRKADLSNE